MLRTTALVEPKTPIHTGTGNGTFNGFILDMGTIDQVWKRAAKIQDINSRFWIVHRTQREVFGFNIPMNQANGMHRLYPCNLSHIYLNICYVNQFVFTYGFDRKMACHFCITVERTHR